MHGRLELVGQTATKAPVFVDYAHTPDGLNVLLRAARPHVRGKLIVVFGCGGDRDATKRPIMGDVARRLADEVVELCLARFISPRNGALLEYFDPTWAPAKGAKGDAIWPGHQFEWAGLLERWALAREGRDDVRAVARRLYDIGMRHGIDAGRGVAVFELAADFSVREPTTRLWVQTEWLKAAMILVRSESEPERRRRFLGDAVAAAKALELFLDLPVRGLWRDKLQGDGTWIDEPAPASSFYHIIDALRVLLQSPAMRGHR